jgi:cytochrome c oxidase cbb3-type subunit 4
MTMDVGVVRGWITVVTLLTFLVICWWAYRSANRQRFEEDGRIPFADDAAVQSTTCRPVAGQERADD